MLKLDRFRIPQGHVFFYPLLDASFGIRGQRPIGDHGKSRPFPRRRKRSILHALRKSLGNAQLFPQSTEQIGATHGNALEESDWSLTLYRPLNPQCLFRSEEAGQAFGESSNRIDIKGVGAAKGVENIRFRLSRFGIPNIMRQLDVCGGRSALVFSGDCSDVHVYSCNVDYQRCQA